MNKTELFYTLKRKENRTLEEDLLLEYRKRLMQISEQLVSYSKSEICEELLISNVEDILKVNDL